jgi:hypothetical protein
MVQFTDGKCPGQKKTPVVVYAYAEKGKAKIKEFQKDANKCSNIGGLLSMTAHL